MSSGRQGAWKSGQCDWSVGPKGPKQPSGTSVEQDLLGLRQGGYTLLTEGEGIGQGAPLLSAVGGRPRMLFGPHYSSQESWCSSSKASKTRSSLGDTNREPQRCPALWPRDQAVGSFLRGKHRIPGGGNSGWWHVRSSGLRGGQSCQGSL